MSEFKVMDGGALSHIFDDILDNYDLNVMSKVEEYDNKFILALKGYFLILKHSFSKQFVENGSKKDLRNEIKKFIDRFKQEAKTNERDK